MSTGFSKAKPVRHWLRISVALALMIPFLLAEAMDDEYGVATQLGEIADPLIQEASGLAISRTTTNAVWMHNDSGDKPRLFLVGLDGTTQAVVNVADVTATDWEDMCSFELDGEAWLLIGDIGDNEKQRGKKTPRCQLLLLKEPAPVNSQRPKKNGESSVAVFGTTTFEFPDGPQDCESLAVDTVSRTILLVTKSDPFRCGMYQLPLTLSNGKQHLKAERIAAPGVSFATAMDVSPDGRRLVIVDMFSGAMITRTDPATESWADACRKPVQALTLPKRKQGETVCFTADGRSLLLNSEGISQPLWRVDNLASQPAEK